jgi:hypothetical protein
MKLIAYMVIGGAAVLTGKYILSLKRAEKKVVVVTSAKKDKITIQGVTILVRYNIKNPADVTMRMTPPLIKLSVNGKLITTSSMKVIDIPEESRDKSGKIIIGAFKETGDIETRLFIPWISIGMVAPDLIARLKSSDKKDKVSLKIETLSQVYSLIGNFPYEQIQTIKL